MSLEETERASAASAVSPATRVSLADIEANIHTEYFITGDMIAEAAPGMTPIPPSLHVLTICIIVCKNGFTVIGKAAPADAQNFNPELGRKFAREDAIRQLWPLMGYALREKLAA